MENKILTFGDSHSYCFPPYVNMNHLGPVLAYSIGRDGINAFDLRNYNINDGDHLIFCFGEIDCRCHISKYHDRNNDETYKHNIGLIVSNYLLSISENLRLLGKDVNVWIYNVVPPVKKGDFNEDPNFPLNGTDEERRAYVLCMNTLLKSGCLNNNWGFFDIYDKYKDESGYLIREMSDGYMHILNTQYIDEFIQEYINKI